MRLANYDYRGMGEWLVGPEARRLVESKANDARLLYQATVAKRSGALARSAKVSTRISETSGRRWAGVLSVGGDVTYGASHEFGTKGDQKRDAARDLNRVLSMLRRV